MKNIIYGLVDPENHQIRYIGYTSNSEKRLKEHHSPCRLKKKSHKINWIKSLLAKGLRAELILLEECLTSDELPQAEIKMIEYYKSIGANLTNSTIGGDGASGYVLSQETKDKLSEVAKGRIPWNKGLKGVQICSDETRLKMSKVRAGKKRKPQSEETKRKISESRKGSVPSNKGKPMPEKVRQALLESHKKKE